MRTLDRLLAQQMRFAASREIEHDPGGFVLDPEANFVRSLDERTREEIAHVPSWRSGQPKPGELERLASTIALVCNVFAPWRGQPLASLCHSLGAPTGATGFRFAPEQRRQRGDPSAHPAVDLLLEGSSVPTAIVASFCEPYSGAPSVAASPRDLVESLLALPLLPGCQNLAQDLSANPRRYTKFDVCRVLEAIAWLHERYGPRGFRLIHLFHDDSHASGDSLRGDIDRFRMRVGGEIDFRALSWSCLFARLRQAAPGEHHASYHGYLSQRYDEPSSRL